LKKRRTLNIELSIIQNEFLLEHSTFDVECSMFSLLI